MPDDTQGPTESGAPPSGPPPPPEGGAQVRNLHPGLDYATKMCPLLTAAALRPKPASALIVPGQTRTDETVGDDAVACQGPACEFYLQEAARDERTGKIRIVGGGCAIKVNVNMLSNLGGVLQSFINVIGTLTEKLKIKF